MLGVRSRFPRFFSSSSQAVAHVMLLAVLFFNSFASKASISDGISTLSHGSCLWQVNTTFLMVVDGYRWL